MKSMMASAVVLVTLMLAFFPGVAPSRENRHVVVHVQVLNKDDGRPLANKEISLFKWKTYLFGIASKRYLISKAATDQDGRASFSVDRRDSLDLRFKRCPKDTHGMIYTFKDDDFIESDRDIIISYSLSECAMTFYTSQGDSDLLHHARTGQ